MDKLGRPAGAHRPELVSYIGVLVRECSKVLANITNWWMSPHDVRDRVHNAIREKFIIENELSEEDLLRLTRKKLYGFRNHIKKAYDEKYAIDHGRAITEAIRREKR
uniref:Uncharacterized protein n=1 Tax=Nelumbo nucifera TaxID=4432 RepID=A0A822XYL6_NELNU|nr:TPA_asm: hypothetical protein HUJ06_023961 [Nelumbo nucifera]